MSAVHLNEMTFRASYFVLVSKQISIVLLLQVYLNIDQILEDFLAEVEKVYHLASDSSLLVHDRVSLILAFL